MLSLLTGERSFDDPWVGSVWLNRRLALHRRRIALARAMAALRRRAAIGLLARGGGMAVEIGRAHV